MVGQQVIVKGEDFMGENCRHKLGCGRIGPYSMYLCTTKPYKKSSDKAYFTPYKANFEELYLYQ